MEFRYYMKCQSCNIETKMENNNSERKSPKKAVHSTHNLDSTDHVISILHDGRSRNIETTYQPILAVTDPLMMRTKVSHMSLLEPTKIEWTKTRARFAPACPPYKRGPDPFFPQKGKGGRHLAMIWRELRMLPCDVPLRSSRKKRV